jgi:predicted dehydrogenase
MHKWHYHPGIEALRLVGRSGRIGAIEEMFTVRHSLGNHYHGADIFAAKVIHDLTIIKHIFGYLPLDIGYSKVIRDTSGVPFSLTAIIGRSPSAYILVNNKHADKRSGVSVHGSKGMAMLYDSYDDHITVIDEKGEERIKIDTTFPLLLELKEFIGYLNGGPKPLYGMHEAREMTSMLLALREKSKSGKKHEQ